MSDETKKQALGRLRGFRPLVMGETVFLLCAMECEGCEDSKEPIVDPRSFSWLPGTVTGVGELVEDSLFCVRVTDEQNGEGLYERRYVVTRDEMALLSFPPLSDD